MVRYQLPGFYLLFSGGTLANDQHIDVAAARRVRELFPALSLFGGSMGQQILPGKLKVGCMYPVAAETQRVLPEFMRRPDAPSWRFLTFDRSFVRADDLKNLALARFTRAPAEQENRGGKKKKNPQQMRYTVELVAAGNQQLTK